MKNQPIKEKLIQLTFEDVTVKSYLEKKKFTDKDENQKEDLPRETERVFLALAYNMAYENYKVFRDSSTKKFTHIDCPDSLIQILILHNSDFKLYLLEEDYLKIDEILNLEYSIFRYITLMRNYHSHVIHEPGPLNFKDLFAADEFPLKDRTTQVQFDNVKAYFIKKFEFAKEIKTEYLEKCKMQKENSLSESQNRQDREKAKLDLVSIDKAIVDLGYLSFQLGENQPTTFNAQLFIAAMFLRKGQIAMILDKWQQTKHKRIKNENTIIEHGYNQSLKGFYSFYSVRDGFSLKSSDPDIEQFRKILSQLNVMPEFPNPNMSPLYEYIRDQNQTLYEMLKPIQKDIKLKRTKLKAFEETNKISNAEDVRRELLDLNKNFEAITNKIIPLRKANTITPIIIRFLEENDVFVDFEIACRKQPSDIMRQGTGQSVTEMKNKLKGLTGVELREAKESYKIRRKRYIFKKPGETNYKYAIGSNNAILRYKIDTNTSINVVMGDDLMLKLALLVLKDKKMDVQHAMKNITTYIRDYYNSVATNKQVETVKKAYGDGKPLSFKKAFPQGFNTTLLKSDVLNWINGQENADVAASNIQKRVQIKKKKLFSELSSLVKLNRLQKKPWRFASQKKIAWIMRCNHIIYSFAALKNGKTDADIRHEGLNTEEHDRCYLYLRFFRQFKGQQEFNDFFEYNKQPYFSKLLPLISESDTLEELFIAMYKEFNKWDKKNGISKENISAMITVLKVGLPNSVESVADFLQNSAPHNVMLHPDIILLKELFRNEYQKLSRAMSEKEEKGIKKYKSVTISEQAMLRHLLKEPLLKTNTDFIYQNLQEGKWLNKIDLTNYRFDVNNFDHKIDNENLDEKKKHFKKVCLRTYLDLKTKELVIWGIANFYWKSFANARRLAPNWNLPNNSETELDFKKFNSFYKIFNHDLTFKLPNTNVNIRVSARKLDDEYLYPEIAKLQNRKAIDSYHFNLDEKGKLSNPMDFLELLRRMKKELNKSFIDIGLILVTEKILVNSELTKFEEAIQKKYSDKGDELISDLYLEYSAGKNQYGSILEGLKIEQNKCGFSAEDLNKFRNNALHYQLQEKALAVRIRDYLQNQIQQNKEFKQYTWMR